MIRSTLLALSAAAALAVGGCNLFNNDRRDDHDDAVEEMIEVDQLPAAVRESFEKQFPGARVQNVEKETYSDGLVHYEFEFVTADGKVMDVEFDADGERLPEH